MIKNSDFEDALAIFRLEGLELTEQEIQLLRELDQMPFSEEQIRAFLKGFCGRTDKFVKLNAVTMSGQYQPQ
ncbi:MAG: DUF1456 family protein [Aestuariibacter sp.]|nr:DUF1456 family protein [Aestuariibacter sp.]MCP5017424.1 DUF1456 family protein [Ketobacter sp.]